MNAALLSGNAVCLKKSPRTASQTAKTLKLHWLSRFLTLQDDLKIQMVARLGARPEYGKSFSIRSSRVFTLLSTSTAFNRLALLQQDGGTASLNFSFSSSSRPEQREKLNTVQQTGGR